ncbi:CYTH domain-containing protein [Flavobacteriaceae bacterium AU392]|nr:CYTH domain-containing protein [Flavobacteriaceae bacterium]RKM84726.1 CYTH domain-containing protein [Flavobacteriaceae bacterium AU392]
MIEIERKFLVNSTTFKTNAIRKTKIIQGFLNTNKERTVRIRLKGEQGYLTVKGQSTNDGMSRFEWEKEISKTDAETLFPLCEKGMIDKIRYEIVVDRHIFEVDEFFGDNLGLIIAEIELNDVTETFRKPDWLGKEVTGDIKYYNSQLSKQPYSTWDKL